MNRTTRTVAVVVGGPVLVSLVVGAVAWSIRGDLPDPVAVHWTTTGPDGFAPRAGGLLLVLLGLPVGLLVGGLVARLAGRAPGFRRLGAGLAVGLTAGIELVVLGTLWTQRGLTDAADAPTPTSWLLLAVLVAVVLGVLAARLVPPSEPAPALEPVPGSAPRLALGEGESGAWSRWVVAGWWVFVVAGVAVTPVAGLVAMGVVPVGFLAVVVGVLVIVAGSAVFRVTAGRRGVVVSSVLGVPRFTVPLEEVAEAGVATVDPLRDFGGWGYRAARGGRYGVVVRGGEALSVRRGDGTTFVVTVDRPAEAAALLNTLADRQRSAGAEVPHRERGAGPSS